MYGAGLTRASEARRVQMFPTARLPRTARFSEEIMDAPRLDVPMSTTTVHYLLQAAWIMAILALFVSRAGGQEAMQQPLPPSIRTMGEATLTVSPDQVRIDIGVVTQAETAQPAAVENAQKLEAVLAELRQLLGPKADIKTINYSLSPSYRYPKQGGTPTITGYTATNTVQVKTNDLSQIGKIIDTSMQSSANRIESLRFTLQDEQAVYLRALSDATARARAKAEAMASVLGLRIVRVLSAEEGGLPPRPVLARTMEARAAPTLAETPVEPGTIEVRATVGLAVEIAP
jgi:uncharacterized protein YggE